MSLFEAIGGDIKKHNAYPKQSSLSEALRTLPYRLSVAWVKVSLAERNYGKLNFWTQERQRAEEILKRGEAARIKYYERELDPAVQSSVAKELSRYMSELEDLIKRLDQKSLEHLANSSLLNEEISKMENLIDNLSSEFEGYRFWLSGKDSLNAARLMMNREPKLEELRSRAEKIRKVREGLVTTAQNLRAVNAKLLELQRYLFQQPVNDRVRNQLFVSFALIKSQTMKVFCQAAIFVVLSGRFEEVFWDIMSGKNNRIEKAFAVFGLQPGATYAQVKKIYREGMWKNHEDKNKSPEAQERARELTVAFGVIRKYFDNLKKQNPIGNTAN